MQVAEELRQRLRVPGAGIAIVHENEVVFVGGIGFSNVKKQTAVTGDTLFAIGSNTKAFTGLLVSKLNTEKKLDWFRPIKDFIPALELSDPYVTKNVTLADACSHMTGLARRDDLWKGTSLSRQQVFEQAGRLPFHLSLRENFSYNNHMYVVVGRAIEEVTGDSWEDNIRTRIFEALGMNDSFVTYEEFMSHPKKSIGYAADGVTVVPHLNVDHVAPAGSIASTPRDLAKWLRVWVNKGQLDDGPYLTNDEYRVYAEPRSATMAGPNEFKSYWAGWSEKILDGKVQFLHSGGIDGQNSRILARPSDGFGILVMTNQGSDFKDLLIDYAEQMFVNGKLIRDGAREKSLLIYSEFARFRMKLLEEGIKAAGQFYESIPEKKFEDEMNDLGYELISREKLKQALFVFKLNCRDNSQSANTWDSLGECYYLLKDYPLALQNYQKSLELDDNNPNGKLMISKIEELMKR